MTTCSFAKRIDHNGELEEKSAVLADLVVESRRLSKKMVRAAGVREAAGEVVWDEEVGDEEGRTSEVKQNIQRNIYRA